jgi:hypothetical protein
MVLAAVAAVFGAGLVAVTAADASTPPHVPFGHFDALSQTTSGFAVRGWALDPDTKSPINVDVYVDGHNIKRMLANVYRPDIGRLYGMGNYHGYAASFPRSAGSHHICIKAIDVGAGTTNPIIACKTIVLNYDPQGLITSTKQFPGGFTTTGWAVDPNQPTTALTVDLIVDGSHTPAVTANIPRDDVARLKPAAGPNHGFSIKVKAAEGTHRVCLYMHNVGLGANATTGCRNVTLNFSPVGAITSLSQAAGGFRVGGSAVDPDTTSPVTVRVYADGIELGSTIANLASTVRPGHGYATTVKLGGTVLPPGTRQVCVHGVNLGSYGINRTLACTSIALNFNPTAAVATLVQSSPGIRITGWAQDPDTSNPVSVAIKADGVTVTTVVADRTGSSHSGHIFAARAPLPNGKHELCAVAINLSYGNGNSKPDCRTITLNFNPYGRLESLARASGSTSVVVRGWGIDPDTTSPIQIRVSIDGTLQSPLAKTTIARPDVLAAHPGTGGTPGFQITYKANDGEHKVCASAVNVLGGTANTSIGCRIINAVHPVVPSAPRSVVATPGYTAATVTWVKPVSDGGAPWTYYLVTASPGGRSAKAGPTATRTIVSGLAQKTTYTFTVVAVNVAGKSPAGKSAAITTLVGPPPQTTPAPISTSRYIRNITGATSTDLAWMRSAGGVDASANPSGHRYLMLLDIGGQDQSRGGVLLSATTRFVSYPNLVADIKAYVDGYAVKQRTTAPATIAIGTNNDVDVSSAAGASWANSVIDPVRSYAAKYGNIAIAGANDIEPGFRGTYTQTKAWLGGYLANTSARFVNNGSADGCSWTQGNATCNNGWTMAGLYYLSAGAAPTRLTTLPQIYNNVMAGQWKYISLTGISQTKPRINFGGPLTEWTACTQAGSCGSLTGTAAWTSMWNQLQSHPKLKVSSLPYSTDLRIDR